MRVFDANGVEGVLIGIKGTFRVYDDSEEGFTDYAIAHSDLNIVIKDKDACFYKDYKTTLDHSPDTLGYNNFKVEKYEKEL